MKILLKKLEETKIIGCSDCDSILEYSVQDVVDNSYIMCPVCKAKIYVDTDDVLFDEYGDKILTKRNISYPSDFYDFLNGVDINDEEINEWVKQCLDSIERQKQSGDDCESIVTGSGNSIVIAQRLPDDGITKIYVCKGYSEAEIEDCDFYK